MKEFLNRFVPRELFNISSSKQTGEVDGS